MGSASPFAQLLERWNQIPRTRQVALGGIVAGALIVLYFVFNMSTQPNLVTAYTGLAPEDSAAMADQLEKDGVSYQLGGGGSTISVPANKVAEVRIKLAQVGLGKGGGVGLEIFDKTNFGATDFVQQVNFTRGMEGELARSINTLEGVKSSRVHIVIPRDALFKEDQKQATASVLVAMKPGHSLDNSQVKGITNLVSNSIEGLKPGGVTIIDEKGHVLFDGAVQEGAFSAGATATQLDLQRQYEAALQRDVESTLTKVVGVGRSAVTVRAHLNFDAVQQTEDKFAAATQVVPRSTTTTTETYTGAGAGNGAIPGASANGGAANAAANAPAGSNTNYTRSETTTNNEVPKTTTTTVKAPGNVDRLSVSVVLDDSLTAAQEASITSTVAAAVGLDQTRGDTLSVARLPFDASVKDEFAVPAGDGIGQYLQYLKLLIPILAVVLGFVLVMLLLRSLGKRQAAFPAPAGYRATVLAGAGSLGAGGMQQFAASAPLPALEPSTDPQEERVMRLADGNPRAVADVVQTWMREEDR